MEFPLGQNVLIYFATSHSGVNSPWHMNSSFGTTGYDKRWRGESGGFVVIGWQIKKSEVQRYYFLRKNCKKSLKKIVSTEQCDRENQATMLIDL